MNGGFKTISQRLSEVKNLSEKEREKDLQKMYGLKKEVEKKQRKKEMEEEQRILNEEEKVKREKTALLLGQQLQKLGKEIENYETELDPRVNNEDYHRLKDHCNYLKKLFKQERLTQEDIDELRSKWSSGGQKDSAGTPEAFLLRERYKKERVNNFKKQQRRNEGALFYHGISFVCFIVGIFVGVAAQSWFAFLLILINVIIVNIECERLEHSDDYTLKTGNHYIFYVSWLILSSLCSVGLFLSILSKHREAGAWGFAIITSILLIMIFALISNMKKDN